MTLDEYLGLPDAKSPAALAEEVGISESTLSRIRRGKQNTTRDVILKIIAATGRLVTADALVGVHAVDSATDDADVSATNEGENIGPFVQAPEQVPARPCSVASQPTCSPTSAPSAESAASQTSSNSPEAEAA